MEKFKIYTRAKCPYCQNLVKVLDKEGLEYENIDIGKNPEAAKDIITRNGHSPVPQVELPGKIIFDYDTEESLVEEIKGLLEG